MTNIKTNWSYKIGEISFEGNEDGGIDTYMELEFSNSKYPEANFSKKVYLGYWDSERSSEDALVQKADWTLEEVEQEFPESKMDEQAKESVNNIALRYFKHAAFVTSRNSSDLITMAFLKSMNEDFKIILEKLEKYEK